VLLDVAARCDAVGEKLIVFSQSIATLNVIEDAFKHSALKWTRSKQQISRIEGSVSAEQRQDICKRFNASKKGKAVLISTRAVRCSLGVAPSLLPRFSPSTRPLHCTPLPAA
jgi:SNF2 family DNA or RNA helicase